MEGWKREPRDTAYNLLPVDTVQLRKRGFEFVRVSIEHENVTLYPNHSGASDTRFATFLALGAGGVCLCLALAQQLRPIDGTVSVAMCLFIAWLAERWREAVDYPVSLYLSNDKLTVVNATGKRDFPLDSVIGLVEESSAYQADYWLQLKDERLMHLGTGQQESREFLYELSRITGVTVDKTTRARIRLVI